MSDLIVRKANVFLFRGDTVLFLQSAGGTSKGWWYVPGGDVDEGETPEDAAIREVQEETALRIDAPTTLAIARDYRGRPWSHAIFAARAPDGDVMLSTEHSAYKWLSPASYIDGYCSEHLGAVLPEQPAFFGQIRKNCALTVEWARRQA